MRRPAAHRPRIIAIEATGGFETVLAAGLAAAKLPVAAVNPAQVRANTRLRNRYGVQHAPERVSPYLYRLDT